MSEEFKKLDEFMLRNRPDLAASKRPGLPLERPKWIGYAVACGISAVIAFGVINQHYKEAETALALSEVLSWDVTSDEFPAEIDSELAMLDF